MISRSGELHQVCSDAAIVFNGANIQQLMDVLNCQDYQLNGVVEFPALAIVNQLDSGKTNVKLISMKQLNNGIAHYKDFVDDVLATGISLLQSSLQRSQTIAAIQTINGDITSDALKSGTVEVCFY